MRTQVQRLALVMPKSAYPGQIFVDGGFCQNDVFMQFLANSYPGIEVYASGMSQATSLGAALVISSGKPAADAIGEMIGLRRYHPYSPMASSL